MEWKKFLVKYYDKKKAENPNYKFSKAMKDARTPYRKQMSGGGDPITEEQPEEQPQEQPEEQPQEQPEEQPTEPADATEKPADASTMVGGKKSRRMRKRSAKRRGSKKRRSSKKR